MAKQKEEKKSKSDLPVARVTCFLSGSLKKQFFDDIQKTGQKECHLAREIIKKYYSSQLQINSNTLKHKV